MLWNTRLLRECAVAESLPARIAEVEIRKLEFKKSVMPHFENSL